MKTLWHYRVGKYRVGKYRVAADIVDDEFVVVVLKTSKRDDVYRNK
ncbi:hypothetical protein GCM10025878_02140 [Leuconostoc gasicomitatum]|nr:hypothetical protein GCM10025878_02140 [Leuconostoc gasicomitatum]